MTSEWSPSRTSKPQANQLTSLAVTSRQLQLEIPAPAKCASADVQICVLCFVIIISCYQMSFPTGVFCFVFVFSPCKIAFGDSSAAAKSKAVDATVKWTLEAAKVQLSLQLKVTLKLQTPYLLQ